MRSRSRSSGVSVDFGGMRALDGVSLELQSGEVLGLIGPERRGQDDALRRHLGGATARRRAGAAGRAGHDRRRARSNVPGGACAAPSSECRSSVGSACRTTSSRPSSGRVAGVASSPICSPSRPASDESASASRAPRGPRSVRTASDVRDEPAGTLPIGMARMVELARALVASPRILLLDEPSSGLSAVEAGALGECITRVKSEGELLRRPGRTRCRVRDGAVRPHRRAQPRVRARSRDAYRDPTKRCGRAAAYLGEA